MVYLKEDDITDIDKIDEYNREYLSVYPDFKPFVNQETYPELLSKNKLIKKGINNKGVKEIFYWAIEKNKIVGHASIRLNPEVDDETKEYFGHLMYGVVPSMRYKGYGTIICHLLIEKSFEFGLKTIMVTCRESNIGSSKVIENNFGILKDIIYMPTDKQNQKRYIIDTEYSLKHFKKTI